MPIPIFSIQSGSSCNLRIPQGSSLSVSLTVRDPNTGLIEDLTSSTFVLTVKARDNISGFATGSDVFNVAGVLSTQSGATLGQVTFALTPGMTSAMLPAVYVFDIFQTDGSGNKIASIPLSRFEVLSVAFP